METPESHRHEVARQDTAYPVLDGLIEPELQQSDELQVDTYEEVYALERSHRAISFIREWYLQPDLDPLERALASLYAPMHSVSSVGNQFGTKLTPCFLEPDTESGLEMFRSIIPNTVDEEMALLLTDEQYAELHSRLAEHLAGIDGEVHEVVNPRLEAMKVADRNQFNDGVDRSLERILQEGMVISFDPARVGDLEVAHQLAGEGILPITEYVKNEKVLRVNGFMDSKISLAIHDFMDHLWTFDTIRKAGLLDKYSELFASVGNPELTDIFKREGEMVASIAFGIRLFQTMPSAFGPLMQSSAIETHLDDLFVAGELEQRHMTAYRTIKSLRKGSVEWQSLGFAFSNYITELDEQRRKHGKIKQRDPRTRKIIGELDPLSPDYLCFFIDTHTEIMSSKNKHRDDLFRFHILLEECLHATANGEDPGPRRILLGNLRGIDFRSTRLPVQRLHWMRNNYGFTATRDAII